MRKRWIPLVLVPLVLAGCATVSTQPDTVALHYKGGPISSTTFDACVGTGSRDYAGPGDHYYIYPASQRYYEFDSGKGDQADSGSITFVTADGIEMAVTGVVNFTLNTDCDTLRAFHEKIGNRTSSYFTDGANAPDGWKNMLDVYIGQALNTAVDRAGQAYPYASLYNDTATKTKWEQEVNTLLPELVNRQTDGEEEFFQNFSITLQKPEPPAEVKAALVQQQAAVAKQNAAKAEADAAAIAAQAQIEVEKAEAEKARVWVGVIGADGYLKQQAIEKGLNPWQPTGTPLVNSTPAP